MILNLVNQLEAEGVPSDLAQQYEQAARSALGPIVLSARLYLSSRKDEPLQVTVEISDPKPDTVSVIEGATPEDLKWNLLVFRNKKQVPPKLLRTPGGTDLEVREVTPWPDEVRSRQWFVRDPAGRATFDVLLTPRTLNSTPPGTAPIERGFTPDVIERAVVLTVDGVLISRETRGKDFVLAITADDLYRAAGVPL